MNIHEWFDLIERSDSDQEIVRHLLHNLRGYRGAPPVEDLVQFINFLGAVRLHQLRDSHSE